MNKTLLPLLFLFLASAVSAQFVTQNSDTLYGNEWIDHELEYYKIPVAEDGMYRLGTDVMAAAGIPVSDLSGGNFQMIHNGEVYPIYVSADGIMGSSDFIEFYGRRNRGELDAIFYEDPEAMQLNPEYSLFTDTAAYFLTWNSGNGNLRVNEAVTPSGGGGIPEVEYYMHKERLVLSNRIHKPTRNGGDNVRYSHFDVGEGFGGGLNKRNEVTLKASEVYEGGTGASVDIRFTTNATSHDIKLTVNGDLKNQWQHSGYLVRQETVQVAVSELKANNAVTLEGQVDNVDRNIMSVVDLNYPREFDFGNEAYFEFYVEEGFQDQFVRISRFNGGSEPVIYDPGSATRITPAVSGSEYGVVIPGAGKSRSLVAFSGSDGVREVQGLEKMDFVDYSDMDGEFIIISHPRLMEGAVNQVEEYASYRSSAAGGGFQSVIVNVEDLYEQFSYGVHRHSYSVKNFVNWAAKNWAEAQYVFILGKAREYGVFRTKAQLEDPVNRNFSIPTFGMPGSDNLLVSDGSLRTTHVLPTGRIAAKDVDDVALYLEKVKQHEDFENKPQTIEDRLWKKRVMHLAGAETSLQESIGSYLESMEEELERSQYGAKVTTFRKSSTETIQEADAQELLDNIDRGLSILTFFGHSSVGTFDFNIDDVNKLKNFEKYPLVISLGCFSGNVHTQSYGISEQYVLTGGRGAIAFMASSSTAYVAPQGGFGEDYYHRLGNEYYGRSLGDAFRSSLQERDDISTIHSKILNEQMTLHGDPAIKLFAAEAPDYVFDHSSFSTEPNVIESNQSEFDLSFRVVNLGRFVEDSLAISLQHIVSDGSIGSDFEFKINAPDFDTLINLRITNTGSDNVGRNVIKGELDKEGSISEAPAPGAEENNLLVDSQGEEGYQFFSINNSAIPVSPCDFGIYNEEDLVLRASTYNAISAVETDYILEFDTTALFNSSFKERTTITSIGGLLEWSPQGALEHGRSYYWRVSPDSTSADLGYRWEDASFVYLPNSSNGWNQSHYYQYLDNEYDGIYLDNETRKFEFDTSGFFIKIFNSVWDPNITGFQFNFETYAISVRPWNFMQSGIAVAVLDGNTGGGWTNSGGDYGSINTSNFGSFRCFGYDTSKEEDRASLINLLNNEIPEGNFVFVWTVLRNFDSDFKPELWNDDLQSLNTSIYESLESEGAQLVTELKNLGSVPYTFIYQKGRKVLTEEIGETKESLITSTSFIPVRSSDGSFRSSRIGPAKRWDRLLLGMEYDGVLDTTQLDIIGVSVNGDESILISTVLESEVNLTNIDANVYPFLKIRLDSKDEENYTPGHLDFLRVIYEGYPDLSINTNENFVFSKDTLQQGEELEITLRFDNISEYYVDSVEVEISITDEANQTINYIEKISFSASNQIEFNYKYNTSEMLGRYQVSIDINEDRSVLEKTFVNNFGVREFVVVGDAFNPTLDISFDGNQIMDGDIVSSRPIIRIELRDENEYLLLDDPNIIEIAIIDPSGSEEIIPASDGRINFIPATDNQNNKAIIELLPGFLVDGVYSIEVKASDRSANISGDLNYVRSFEVINEQLISNVLNYPNPFSTSTEFVFTLTGLEIPNDIKIQVLTVSGKIVKEIFKEELGPLKIGLNRTSYKYDGTDDYGNKLANGVYLYRVISKINDENVDKYEITTINSYFKNNLGKMVILR